ncbi:MAG TPA: undecaprenyl diphosphate synthase family protein [Lachnospiraceae bacterium]|nr:undecaprenyl diphosphate synthase family protein [Lachnospiraceae bacterium]
MRIPKHIGIIPDGNRRWAKSRELGKEEGYEYGLNPGLRLLQLARKYGVEEITYYGFTVDNCKRPKEQVNAFKKACVDAVKLIENENVSILVVGNTNSECFPKELLPYTKREQELEQKDRIKTNFLINYGWEWDIKNGFLSKEISRIDMIIRWGGMCRLSGFLPIQSVYADFYIIKDYWPDFKESQFEEAIEWYQKQDVTLGG